MAKSRIITLIWDWNGTLLNDLDICLASINQLLGDRSLPQLTREKYLQVFDFPVKDYYERIGFNFKIEPFSIPAQQFMELYYAKLNSSLLHQHAKEVLNNFKALNYEQYILSAAEEQPLRNSLADFSIAEFFTDVAGLDNHYAHSKLEVGKLLLSRNAIDIASACLIGDTTHDFEVATTLGIQCVLIANGHQSLEKLNSTGVPVFRNIKDFADHLK